MDAEDYVPSDTEDIASDIEDNDDTVLYFCLLGSCNTISFCLIPNSFFTFGRDSLREFHCFEFLDMSFAKSNNSVSLNPVKISSYLVSVLS